jgi:uncharacterized membrane protein
MSEVTVIPLIVVFGVLFVVGFIVLVVILFSYCKKQKAKAKIEANKVC